MLIKIGDLCIEMSLRFAALSDIHGNYHAITAVLQDLQVQGIKKIIVAGDTTGPPMQNQVFQTLMENKATMINGNGESRIQKKNRYQIPSEVWNRLTYAANRWIYNNLDEKHRNLIEFLPDQRILEYKHTSPVRVVHGSPKDKQYTQGILPESTSKDSMNLQQVFKTINLRQAIEYIEESVLICGHTHRPWNQKVDDVLVVNPGSVGNPCNGDPSADYAVFTWSNDEWSVEHCAVEYDLDAAYSSFLKSGALESGGAIAKASLLGRMIGVDVSLAFLSYVKEIQKSGLFSYVEAYESAEKSFDWQQYTR